MFTKINSGGIQAVGGFLVSVEAGVSGELPTFSIFGHLASEVRKSRKRVRTTLRNSGFRLPTQKITMNLPPAGIREGGAAYDLAIAAAILGAFERVDLYALQDYFVIGELGLGGKVEPVNGVLFMVNVAKEHRLRRYFLPVEDARKGLVIQNIDIVGVGSLEQMVCMLRTPGSIEVLKPDSLKESAGDKTGREYDVGFRDVNGQLALRRVAGAAASGMHGLLMSGSVGTGETMVIRRILTIIPALSREEDIKISKIYSICGMLPQGQPLLSYHPLRNPHHTITPLALTGGGGMAKSGELFLASGGILFLDGLPHFGRKAIGILRRPLEERRVTVTRTYENYEFPADFLIVMAINPRSYGFYPDRTRCNCPETQIQRYLEHISQPVLSRFDLYAEADVVSFEGLSGKNQDNEDSASIREQVEATVQIQRNRHEGTGIRFSNHMGPREVAQYCVLGQKEKRLIKSAYEAQGLSAGRYHKALGAARTVADLAGCGSIRREHLAEALGYGILENELWE